MGSGQGRQHVHLLHRRLRHGLRGRLQGLVPQAAQGRKADGSGLLNSEAGAAFPGQLSLFGDPAETVASRDTLQRILEEATPEVAAICTPMLRHPELNHRQIGAHLGGMTARAVEGQPHRLRRIARELATTGKITMPRLCEGGEVMTVQIAPEAAMVLVIGCMIGVAVFKHTARTHPCADPGRPGGLDRGSRGRDHRSGAPPRHGRRQRGSHWTGLGTGPGDYGIPVSMKLAPPRQPHSPPFGTRARWQRPAR